jgi:RNA polymerase sigma-70 factor (ECF subfamily)
MIPVPTRHCPLDQSDVAILRHEAERAAARLVRSLRLPGHCHDDLCQDLLVDLIARLKWYDPQRGSLGAFAGKIIRHRASRLAKRMLGERRHLVSLEDMAASGRLVPERTTNPFPEIDRGIDRDRAEASLPATQRSYWTALNEDTLSQISRGINAPSRATLHRVLRDIRLTLMMAGFPVAHETHSDVRE